MVGSEKVGDHLPQLIPHPVSGKRKFKVVV